MNLMFVFSPLFHPRRSPRSPLAAADGMVSRCPDHVDNVVVVVVVSSRIAEQTAVRSSQSGVCQLRCVSLVFSSLYPLPS